MTVAVLSRTGFTRDTINEAVKDLSWPHLDVSHSTVHAAKGQEADHVILPGLITGQFPNTRQDDPILTLAMPTTDPFPFADERRLFYVALTRARRSVAVFTLEGKESPFLLELVNAGTIIMRRPDGSPVQIVHCPACRARMVKRYKGGDPNKPFWGCSRWRDCRAPNKSVTGKRTSFRRR